MNGPCLTTGILEIDMLTLRNKFDALQEILVTPPPNDEYENLVNAHVEAAVESIETKHRAP